MSPDSFTLDVPESDLAELQARLAATRWPDQTPGDRPWDVGVTCEVMRDLVDHWRSGFDWREHEAALNSFPQGLVEVHGVPVHFLHVPGRGPDPTPLLLLHGWPGSVFEFLDVIPRLTDPSSYGGDDADSFTVVAPSLPGYGASYRPGQRRLGPTEMGDVLTELMTDVLGLDRFGLQGGDWGSFVGSGIAVRHPEHVIGLHLNYLPITPPEELEDPTAEERQYLTELEAFDREGTGYAAIHGTRPQTLAFAMTDSPVGLAAWIVEKMHAWSDHGGETYGAISRDQMLANVSWYWFTGAIGSSFWPYYARSHGDRSIPEGRTVDVPTAYAAFPREIRRPPRSVAERTYSSIRRWTDLPRGGHFAALEQPALLAGDVAAFFAALRA